MIRLDFENNSPVVGIDADKLIQNIIEQLNEGRSVDAVVISDYGKGVCTEYTCQKIIKESKKLGIKVIVDPKGKDWEKYRGANYITPNLSELNAVLDTPVKNDDKEVEIAAKQVLKKYKIENMIITRSERGLTLVEGKGKVGHVKAKAREVFDVSGAGDTVIAVFSLALAGGLESSIAAYLANLAAGVVVGKVGTYAVSREEVLEVLV